MAVGPDERHSSLPVHRAFVVHFGTDGGPRRRFCGRVEHLSTGRAARFSSLKTLLGFVAGILDGSQPAAPPSPTDAGDVNRSKGGASQ